MNDDYLSRKAQNTSRRLPQPIKIKVPAYKCDKTHGCESVIVGFVKNEVSEAE
jgi:hypothetical protein